MHRSKAFTSVLFSALVLSPIAEAYSVEIIAHRGASYDAPENTVAAFREAWSQQADAAEFDLHMTKDGQIVVIHDKTTDRTTGSPGSVVEKTLRELRRLDAGSWKDGKFLGERLPTVKEMFATTPPGKRVFLEVKCGPEVVPELLRSLALVGFPPQQTPVISFNAEVIAAVKEARPELPAYWLVNLKTKNGTPPPTAAELIRTAKAIKADGLDLSVTDTLDAQYARQILDAGLGLYVYTVNDPLVAKRMVQIGVEGITTDRPAFLRAQLREQLPEADRP